MSDISRLLKLAKSALAEGQEPEGQISSVTAYCEAFDAWSEKFDRKSRNIKTGDLLDLQEQHREVMDLAAEMSRRTSEKIKSFRQRARKILSYDQSTPRRVSTRRAKKG